MELLFTTVISVHRRFKNLQHDAKRVCG